MLKKETQNGMRDLFLFAGCGPGVGKDTAADFMIEKFKSIFAEHCLQRESFAKVLKTTAQERFGLDAERMKTDREYKESIRPQLIKLGNDERFLNPFIWADLCEKEFIKELGEYGHQIIAISDCRYMNEPDFFKYYSKYDYRKVVVIYLQCNDETILERFGPEQFAKFIQAKRDRSEREMKHYKRDYLISNDKSKEYLKSCINAIIKEEGYH